MTNLSMTLNSNSKRLNIWWLWGVFIILIAVIFISEMDVTPYLHGDEFMIVDLGRIILHPDSKWSITWLIERNEPVYVFFYIGPVLNEIAYQILGEYGPRIFGLIGAFMASAMMLGWLISRKTPAYFALLLSLVFLLDPIFVQSYTIGRVDGWAMTFGLLACWVLRSSFINQKKIVRNIIAAGGFTIIAVFIWPSSVFLIPLILGELYYLTKEYSKQKNKSNFGFKNYILFGLAGITAAMLLMAPIAPQLYSFFTNIIDGVLVNMFRGSSTGEHFNFHFSLNPLLEIFRGLKFTPILVLLALVGGIIKRDIILILGAFAVVLIMFFTIVYLHRVQYLVPYLILIVAGLYSQEPKKDENAALKNVLPRIRLFGGILLVIWVVSISIVARSVLAEDNSNYRDRNLVFQTALNMIGPGDHNVYLSAPEFYLAGRSLGWKMFRRYAEVGDPLTSESIQPIVPNMDYVILQEREITEKFDSLLAEKGFLDSEWFMLYAEPIAKFNGKTTNEQRLRNLFSIFEHPYGPYKLYVRKDYHSE